MKDVVDFVSRFVIDQAALVERFDFDSVPTPEGNSAFGRSVLSDSDWLGACVFQRAVLKP